MQTTTADVENTIDLKDPWGLNYWCEELNLRAEELKEIVRLVGPEALAVRIYLAKRMVSLLPLTY